MQVDRDGRLLPISRICHRGSAMPNTRFVDAARERAIVVDEAIQCTVLLQPACFFIAIAVIT
ncbi:MAG: hypothetical protein E6J90_37775 [Deltaproteobacteria bacterium]|nr:MAG: hypothetical protein E6J90_37775 [Deltaproteobacteria bacterium]